MYINKYIRVFNKRQNLSRALLIIVKHINSRHCKLPQFKNIQPRKAGKARVLNSITFG